MRKLRKFAIVLAVAYVLIVAALLAVMRRPIVFGQVMRHVSEPMMMAVPFKQLWFVARAGRLKAGDAAPDFNLSTADRQARVDLGSFRGVKPVVLVFGSYT
jgi:hypothetical protein